MRDENGLEKCVACGLCAVACPADAIYLEAAENDGTVQAGPRYAKVYQIHKTRCIFCGYCEEACPVSAIFMGKDYELAVYSNKDFIWDKADLLVPATTTASDTVIRRARRHPRRLRERPPDHAAASRRSRLAVRRRCRGCRRPLRAVRRAALLDQGQQRELRSHSGRRSSRRTCTTFLTARYDGSSQGCASQALAARSRRRCTTCAPADLPHPKKGSAKATELADRRRHFVRDEVEACKRMTRRRRAAHARSAAAVSCRRASTRARRRSTNARGDEAAAASVRSPSSLGGS